MDVVKNMLGKKSCKRCGGTTGNYDYCPDCRRMLALIKKYPDSEESKFYKKHPPRMIKNKED